jgi:hypothetical protein
MVHVFEVIGGRWFYNKMLLQDASKDAQNLFVTNLKYLNKQPSEKQVTKIVVCHA